VNSFADNRRPRFNELISQNPKFRVGLIALIAVAVGLIGGAAVAFGPFWAGFAVLAALGCAYALMINTNIGIAASLILITNFPFGTLPFRVGLTFAFLELVLIALMAVWIFRLLSQPDEQFEMGALGLAIIGWLGQTFFSFLLGSNGSPDTTTLHNYFKFVLAILFYFSVINCIRTPAQANWFLRCTILCGGFAALIGFVLYFLPDALALRILVMFGRFGYPTSGRVLRYVEDDVNGMERAIGFSVDPNSFGGMLALIGVIAIVQAVSEKPVLNRKLLFGISGLMSLMVLLTASRAALGGLGVGVLYAATIRYHKLWWGVAAAGVAAVFAYLVLGIGESFVERIVEGIQFEDQANQMRLDEFNNAIEIIQRYPWFGIGFAQAPDIDLGAGVSNIYLAMGSRIGLLGLAGFLAIMVAFFVRGWRVLQVVIGVRGDIELGGRLIAVQASILTALAVGLLDHYFFNIEFSHMVALLWGSVGLALALEMSAERALAQSEEPQS
jgi:O-antigen ligase